MTSADRQALDMIERTYLEPKETIEPTFHCSICKETLPIYEQVESITDKPVCSDCIGEYCEQRIEQHSDLVTSFIAKHEVEFYLGYYLKGLTSKELLELIKGAFEQKILQDRIIGSDEHSTIKREFCLEHDKFFDFAKGA